MGKTLGSTSCQPILFDRSWPMTRCHFGTSSRIIKETLITANNFIQHFRLLQQLVVQIYCAQCSSLFLFHVLWGAAVKVSCLAASTVPTGTVLRITASSFHLFLQIFWSRVIFLWTDPKYNKSDSSIFHFCIILPKETLVRSTKIKETEATQNLQVFFQKSRVAEKF